jgi:hypothetical protein
MSAAEWALRLEEAARQMTNSELSLALAITTVEANRRGMPQETRQAQLTSVEDYLRHAAIYMGEKRTRSRPGRGRAK